MDKRKSLTTEIKTRKINPNSLANLKPFAKDDPRINRNGGKSCAAWMVINAARKIFEEEIDTKRGKMKRIEKIFLELVESKKYESILKLISMIYGLDKLELTGDVLIKWVKIQQPPSETLAGQGKEESAT